MKCSQCHGAVDEQATACRLCRAALVLPIQCSHCRAVNRPSSQFCDQCGNLLEQDSDPFIDMLNQLFEIREEDVEAVIGAKLQSGIGSLVDAPDAVVPFLAGLYAAFSPEALAAGNSELYDRHQNAGFLLRTLPMAPRLAERYLREAIEIGTQIGTRLRLAQACLDLGLLYGQKKRFNDARKYIARSIDLFDRCGADVLLEEARTALDDLPR